MSEEMLTSWRLRLPLPSLDTIGAELQQQCLKARHLQDRIEVCSRAILSWIEEQPMPCFLLAGVLAYIRVVNETGVTAPLRYQMSSFEAWLERRSGLAQANRRLVRGKIMGQLLPREEYQRLFPIGQDRYLPSSHIVTGHSSPDLDTTISSFWSWCDAWAAPVAERLHYWNIPGGLPDLVEIQFLMLGPFGPQLAELPKARTTLALTAFDLLASQPPIMVNLGDRLSALPVQQAPVAIQDGDGVLVGELRQQDVDRIRQLTNPLMACLHWFERYAEQVLVDFLAQNQDPNALEAVLKRLFQAEIRQADPYTYQSAEQQALIHHLIQILFQLPQGAQATFGELAHAIGQQFNTPSCPDLCFQRVAQFLRGPKEQAAGFHLLSELSHALAATSDAIRVFLEQIDQALRIKEQVLHVPDSIVKGNADVEELRQRMGDHHALLSALVDEKGHRFAEGLITAEDLRRQPVGTVSIRDFCNREEVKIPSYFEVVSVVDHHKISLDTARAPTITVADVQSVNTLMAEQALALQMPYASVGLDAQTVVREKEALAGVCSPSSLRRQQKLLWKEQALQKPSLIGGTSCWVAPERQWWQSLSTLFAILDDTDLLSKSTWRDLEAVMALLNLMASLTAEREVEVVAFDDLSREPANVSVARERLLSTELLEGLLAVILAAKYDSLSANIEAASAGRGSSLFADLKIQNGCAAVGQIKLFDANRTLFFEKEALLQNVWLHQSQDMAKQRPEIDLFIEMISSLIPEPHAKSQVLEAPVKGRRERDKGERGEPEQDELWIWVPPPEASRVHLRVFLANLVAGPLSACRSACRVALIGPDKPGLDRVFREHFDQVALESSSPHRPQTYGDATFAVLCFPRGLLNSRKACITPCLPRLGS
jgi:hypothetical protein